jgi:hypothetical protein
LRLLAVMFVEETVSKVIRKQRIPADEILPEYDFRGAELNKYASQYAVGSP